MDERATGPALSQKKKEKWMSMPASSPRNDTREAQAPAQGSIQDYDYFLGSERSMSPPPVSLEKAVDPSLSSQPNTPAASTISCLSRSSTLTSSSTGQSQDSDITVYSQNGSSLDEAVSVSRSLTLPAMGSYPVDRKSLPKGAAARLFELPRPLFELPPVYPYSSNVSVPMNQASSSRINRYLTWPKRQIEETPAHSNQAPPSRHLTFPMERSSNPTKLEDTRSFVFEANEDRNVPGSTSTSEPLSKTMITPDTEMCYNVLPQEMAPDEAGCYDFGAQADMFWATRLIKSNQCLLESLDSKHDGLYCELAPNASTDLVSQRSKKFLRNRARALLQGRKSTERAINVASQRCKSDQERPRSADGAMFSDASTVVTSEAAVAPEHISRKRPNTQTEEIQESRASSPSPPDKPRSERSRRESSWSDSDDNAGCPHEDCGHLSEEDQDPTYDELVESITNLVLESSCVGTVEERGVPVKLYVHNLLEQILNHPKSPNEKHTLCLPIRSLQTPKNEEPGDAGQPGMGAGGQPGNGGSSGTNKRKNDEVPGHARNRSYGDQDDFVDDLEDLQSHNPQKVKKLKTGKRGGNFSCPFRKRNPIRFNVRDHGNCALNSFADFALLKRHIKMFHQKGNSSSSCVRCKEQFPDPVALTHHLTRRDICQVRDPTGNENPEDGITERIDLALKVRTKEDNVRQWESLWKLLFPNDPSDRIPGSEHEPPVELDEVQDHCYKGDSVREFIHKETISGQTVITDHGFRYFVERFRHCRNKEPHEPDRLERDQSFEKTVLTELSARHGAPPAQPTHPLTVDVPPQQFAPSQWGDHFDDSLLLGDIDVFANQFSPYPQEPIYASHLGVNSSQVPATITPYPPSEHAPAHHAAPQHAPATLPYGAVLAPSGSPCSAAGGSAQRSSVPSSQSHDSSYQTQDTQFTQYTQQSAASFHHHDHQYPKDGRPGGPAGGYSGSTSPGDMPSQHATIPRQRSSELRGIDPRLPVPEEYADAGSNGEEGLVHFNDL